MYGDDAMVMLVDLFACLTHLFDRNPTLPRTVLTLVPSRLTITREATRRRAEECRKLPLSEAIE